MSADYEKLKKQGPDFDCGFCGNASCAAFLRRAYFLEEDLKGCPFILPETQEKLKTILEKRRQKGPATTSSHTTEVRTTSISTPEQEFSGNCSEEDLAMSTLQFSPCAEKEKITMEVHLALPSSQGFSLLDSCDMCLTLSAMRSMDRVSCSKQMGYAVALVNGKRIHVFKNGKLIFRKADSREDALTMLKKLQAAMRPSVVNACGSTLSNCLLAHDSRDPEHGQGLLWGLAPKLKTNFASAHPETSSLQVPKLLRSFFEELHLQAEDSGEERAQEIAETLIFIRKLPVILKDVARALAQGEDYDTTEIHPSAVLLQNILTTTALEFSMRGPMELERASYGVVLHAVGMAVSRAVISLIDLLKQVESGEELDLPPGFTSLVERQTGLFNRVFCHFREAALPCVDTPCHDAECSALAKMELTALDRDLRALVHDSPSEERLSLLAECWKLFSNTRYLYYLLEKEIGF